MIHGKILQTENSRTMLTVRVNQDDDESYHPEPKIFTQFLAAGIATLSALAVGMTLSWTSAALPMLQESRNSSEEFSSQHCAMIGSFITLGAFKGALAGGFIANFFGKRNTLLILAVPMFLHWIMIAFSLDTNMPFHVMLMARLLAGLAIGAISVAAPAYVAEIAHTSVRGTLGTFFQVQITIGLLIEYILGGTVTDFKWLAIVSSVVLVIFFVAFLFMPETPVYLYSRGRLNEARKSLIYFRGEYYDIDEELSKICEGIKDASSNKSTSLLQMITEMVFVKALIVSLGLMLFQQFSGINAVIFYAVQIFQESGSAISPTICAILIGIVQVLATLLSTLLIEKAGRKVLLLVSSSVMSVCLFTLGTYFYMKLQYDLSSLSVLPVICVGLFFVVFSVGFGPIPWIMMSELFTSHTKSIAGSMSAALSWLSAFLVTNQFPSMVANVGAGPTFGLFGIICAFAVLFVALLVPETKGKDVDEVQDMLSGKKCDTCDDKYQKTTYV